MGRRWIAGLVLTAVVLTAAAAGLDLWSTLLFHEADEFYRSLTGTTVYPDQVGEYYDRVWRLSSLLAQPVGPLAAGAVFAILALLAVLALRWERREGAA